MHLGEYGMPIYRTSQQVGENEKDPKKYRQHFAFNMFENCPKMSRYVISSDKSHVGSVMYNPDCSFILHATKVFDPLSS